MKTHSNGCKPRIAIALSGWNTLRSIRSLIAIAPTIVFKSSSGESTCSERNAPSIRSSWTLRRRSPPKRTGSEGHPCSVVRVRPDQACIRVAEFLMWEGLRRLNVEPLESEGGPLRAALVTPISIRCCMSETGGLVRHGCLRKVPGFPSYLSRLVGTSSRSRSLVGPLQSGVNCAGLVIK
jgi:hypothetical protein